MDTAGRRAPWTLLLLALALVCEGFDLQIANFAAPGIVDALAITRGELVPFFTASLLGMLIGAPLLGRVGDRNGRRLLIIAGTIAYALLSLATAAVGSLTALVVMRFLTGIALGGVMPNVFALASEIAPARMRTKAVAVIGIGLSLGGVLAGGAAAALAGLEWRILFAIGGALPLAMAVAMLAWLPEAQPYAGDAPPPRAPLAALFAGALRRITPAIWLVFVLMLMTVYLISSWMPVLLRESGFAPAQAALAVAGYHAGAMLGSLAAAVLIGPRGWGQVAAFAALSAAALALTALAAGSVLLVAAGLAGAGFFIVGAQNALNGSASAAYPPEIRATGLGWGLGIGRIGSILGPAVGGFAATLGSEPARSVLLVQVGPLLVAAAAAWWIARAGAVRA